MKQQNGHLVISLDFEIMWGVRDIVTIDAYKEHLLGEQLVIPRLLSIFDKYGVKGTFSVVGLLFFETKEEMMANLPGQLPRYTDENLTPYGKYLQEKVGKNYVEDKFHFAPHLIQIIKEAPGQEIGTHTFSHYYCLEEGQTIEDFKADIIAAKSIAQKKGIEITSIVFPRNQFNQEYLKMCSDLGIKAYRNNEDSWIYEAKNGKDENLFRRMFRLADAYINLTGHHSHQLQMQPCPVNIPSSRFLRPYSKKLKFLEKLRMSRIKNAMTHAAKNNLVYHLWWHPHNFGINQDENFSFLEEILKHYQWLNEQYQFTSITMTNLAIQLEKNYGG